MKINYSILIYLVTVEKAEKQNQLMLSLKSKYSEEERHYICLYDTLIILGTCTVSCGGCVQFACIVSITALGEYIPFHQVGGP